MIAIVDYGLGNINSLKKAIEFLGYETILTDNESIIYKADAVVLPGVGHFKDGMTEIKNKRLYTILKQIKNQPIIGICLGMQLLFEYSDEGNVEGLGLIPGRIVPIHTSQPIPHLGWNLLKSDHQLLQCDVYFIHSYQAIMNNHVVAYTDYECQIPAIVQYHNCIGIQFHPEKSGEQGLAILNQALKGGFIND